MPIDSKDIPTSEIDMPALAEFEVSASTGRRFMLRELSAKQQMQVDEFGSTFGSTLAYRLARSITRINGQAIQVSHIRGDLDYILDRLTGRELDELMLATAQRLQPSDDATKKELAPAE